MLVSVLLGKIGGVHAEAKKLCSPEYANHVWSNHVGPHCILPSMLLVVPLTQAFPVAMGIVEGVLLADLN